VAAVLGAEADVDDPRLTVGAHDPVHGAEVPTLVVGPGGGLLEALAVIGVDAFDPARAARVELPGTAPEDPVELTRPDRPAGPQIDVEAADVREPLSLGERALALGEPIDGALGDLALALRGRDKQRGDAPDAQEGLGADQLHGG
jgi:hypothetical protein